MSASTDIYGLGCVLCELLTGGCAPWGKNLTGVALLRSEVHAGPDVQNLELLAGTTTPDMKTLLKQFLHADHRGTLSSSTLRLRQTLEAMTAERGLAISGHDPNPVTRSVGEAACDSASCCPRSNPGGACAMCEEFILDLFPVALSLPPHAPVLLCFKCSSLHVQEFATVSQLRCIGSELPCEGVYVVFDRPAAFQGQTPTIDHR